MLRARAFGPNADIHEDPAAMRRLRELEARRAQGRQGTPEALEPTDTDLLFEEFAATAEPPAEALAEASPDANAAAELGPPSRRPRWVALLWIASVVASAAIAATVTAIATSMAPVSSSAGAPQIATLEPTSSVVPVGFFGAEEDALVFEFHGLTIFENPRGFALDGQAGCVTVLRTDAIPPAEDFDQNSWGFDRPAYTGCSIGAFPATVEVPFDVDSPPALVDRFPDGRALQFVLDDSRIGVFLDER